MAESDTLRASSELPAIWAQRAAGMGNILEAEGEPEQDDAAAREEVRSDACA